MISRSIRRRMSFGAVCCLALVGCATTPVPDGVARLVPQSQVLDKAYLEPILNAGLVTVKRDSGFMGSACAVRIFVNNKPLAELDTSEKVVFYLAAGDYVLGAWPTALCGGGYFETPAKIAAGSSSSFRVGHGNSGLFIQPSAQP